MSVPQKIQDTKGCLISPADNLQIAGVIQVELDFCWSWFLCRSLGISAHKINSSAIFSSILWKQLSSKQTHSQGFLSYTVIFSGNSFCTIDVIFLDITNIFQIWSMLAAVIKKLRIATIFFWKILIKQILFFQLLVYPGKILQLQLLWQLTVEREKKKIEKMLDCPKLIRHQTVLKNTKRNTVYFAYWARTVDCFDL